MNGVPWAYFRWETFFLNDICFYMGGVGYYFLLDVGAMFRYGIPIDSFILGDDYLFKFTFVVHLFKDYIFR